MAPSVDSIHLLVVFNFLTSARAHGHPYALARGGGPMGEGLLSSDICTNHVGAPEHLGFVPKGVTPSAFVRTLQSVWELYPAVIVSGVHVLDHSLLCSLLARFMWELLNSLFCVRAGLFAVLPGVPVLTYSLELYPAFTRLLYRAFTSFTSVLIGVVHAY